ncbi:hypothetical protein UJ101_00176 [Flavobacteriaceae bacterium UJ101]|nr:hypothetical protein UJ101_00176 [Flavobacteriaceae bacterium UJ101]
MNTTHIEHLFQKDLLIEIKKVSFWEKYNKNELLIDIGEKITHLPIVLKGSLKVLLENEKDEEILLYYLYQGKTCSIILNSSITHSHNEIKIICLEDSEILFVPLEYIEPWFSKFHSWRSFVLNNFNLQLKDLLKTIDSLTFRNMEERVYKYLKDQSTLLNQTNLDITHCQIAQDLNSSRVVISRTLKKLERNNLIYQTRNKIKLTRKYYGIIFFFSLIKWF